MNRAKRLTLQARDRLELGQPMREQTQAPYLKSSPQFESQGPFDSLHLNLLEPKQALSI
jgi:hypothetical protein